ncbi:hypothetical protein [Leptolyngbya sp. KIOST-1]|uniref:hypothetical protein n=1 Tax=Leptolyngbya sp. KIOST-1 TaxID=1229172 RepID=UPI00055D74CD|nr:hypothetical protein [Leptolyngbya sp. KIOST-1]
MPTLNRQHQKYWLTLLLLAVAGLILHLSVWSTPAHELRDEDIYYIWLEGKRIVAGENPYARVLVGDMRANDKYATYFPLTYLFSALVQRLGIAGFSGWLYLWRPLSLGFHLGLVALTLRYFFQRSLWVFGFVAAAILLLGRWSLYVARVHQLEFAAIFFLVVSLVWLRAATGRSLLAFSVSLGIKQVAIFLLPLYLIHLWTGGNQGKRTRAMLYGLCVILSVPVLTSLPFLVWNAEGFAKSILFSATRLGSSHIEAAPSLDVFWSQTWPWLIGLRAKLPMLGLMGLTYLSFWREKIGILTAAAVVMLVFLYFNSVLFLQYFLWPLSLSLLALVEQVPPHLPQRQP